MRNTLTFLAVSIFFSPLAAADWCRHTRDLATEMSLDGIRVIEVLAVSGELEITGRAGAPRVRASGVACVQKRYADRLDEIAIVEERDGEILRIVAEVPFDKGGEWRIGGLDLELVVPDNLPLRVTDTSGNIDIDGVDSLALMDSSGDVTIRNVPRDVNIEGDSSGDLDLRDVGEVVIARDSSGNIDILRSGSVRIDRDSSGGIRAREVRGDVHIGTDSSGAIEVANVAGDFSVGRDTSGGIDYRDVSGSVRIPEQD